MASAIIRHLDIRRFRGVRSLSWSPHPQLNVIVGAADGGKSTLLEAIGLLFSPAPNYGLSEFDYHGRDVDAGFSIQAILSFSDIGVMRDEGFPAPPMQGWLNGKLTDLPDEAGAQPVLVCQLTGTPDQESHYEVIGAGGEIRAPFSRAMRRRIGLARLGVADRGDRDIRLVQGGALDRYLQGQEVRQAVLQAVMKTPLHDQLNAGSKAALKAISEGFETRNLPHPVRLGLVGTPGVSLAASVGLTVGADDPNALPLSSWGTGTRRLAALEISALGASAETIAVIDEPETGLEPYRQRVFIRDLAADGRQAFVTTHAPAVLAQASKATSQTWRMGEAPPSAAPLEDREEGTVEDSASHALFVMAGTELTQIAATQAEALFAKLPVVCEGVSEVGFATRILEHRFGEGFGCRGIYCLDTGGHFKALPICKALLAAGFAVAAIIDDEGKKSGSWATVSETANLLRWDNGMSLEAAVLSAMPDSQLRDVHLWCEQVTHRSAAHQLAEIRRELAAEKGLSVTEMFAYAGRESFLSAVLAAACPKPDANKKPRGWFKSFDGGYLLADKLLALSPAPDLMVKVDTFLASVETATAP